MTNASPTVYPYRLRIPGPISVPERVRQANAKPVVNHRGAEMRAILGEIQRLIKPLFGTQAPVLTFGSSGTGVMEASLVNVLAPGEKVLALVHGQFGERYAQIARALGAEVDVIESEWGQVPDPQQVAASLDKAQYRAVVTVHNESSTGAVTDLAGIGALLRDRDTLFLVDSISGLAGMELRQDEWGVDIAVTGSQKALMCPPGLGFASVSDKARKVIDRDDRCSRFYFDMRKALAGVDNNETAFTCPVSLLFGLHEALTMIHEEGLPQVFARHKRLSDALRAGCVALGLPAFGDQAAASRTVVVASVPEPLTGGAIVKHMYENYNTVIAGARNKLSGKVIRIGTMGQISEADILTDLHYLERTLTALGHDVPTPGCGVAAAMASLR
ncbi:alanine--glyoxylate aminotransferase family protein [Microvirga sp. 17 mud 1-3]|uniref:pyridoxal-phosphate-dependent aminotransferase family protein n=1 Tax=Microvirga sp. 17 mud 1-3 TaxID=2082949 RepID=UPI000D6B13E3|nr:alanine--glyoxylate aminotransferase family protein [Microvirga sp. 17 mud 1-3]AWM85388.1 aminotransferase [Microvirga sp. 17 mud 1-3]